tara:strand:- start:1469 stop:1792 length:324 start_codon:yes stop_codon:yes gene_type:complete
LTSLNLIAELFIGAALTGQLSGIFTGNTPAIGAMGEAFGGIFGEAELIAPEARRITIYNVGRELVQGWRRRRRRVLADIPSGWTGRRGDAGTGHSHFAGKRRNIHGG